MTSTPKTEEDVAGLLVGSGVFLVQACVVVPGLLPCLLLLLPFVLPLVVLGAVATLLFAVPVWLWRLARAIGRCWSGGGRAAAPSRAGGYLRLHEPALDRPAR